MASVRGVRVKRPAAFGQYQILSKGVRERHETNTHSSVKLSVPEGREHTDL